MPSETSIAPVSVARSTMAAGLKWCCAYVMTSASTNRPSASVLIISTVWPDMDATTSPGFMALPSGMFSTSPTNPITLRLTPAPAIARIAPTTAAEPPISHFMSSMPPAGLIDIPPVSKHTPLPINASGASVPPLFQRMTTMRDSR